LEQSTKEYSSVLELKITTSGSPPVSSIKNKESKREGFASSFSKTSFQSNPECLWGFLLNLSSSVSSNSALSSFSILSLIQLFKKSESLVFLPTKTGLPNHWRQIHVRRKSSDLNR